MVRQVLAWSVFAGLLVSLCPALAHARAGGLAADGCGGCHVGAAVPTVTMTVSPSPLLPGAMGTLTITFPGTTGGLYLRASKGTFTSLANESTKVAGTGIVHSAPKRATGGTVTFRVGWTAPAAPGGVDLNAFVVSGNGDSGSKGDAAAVGFLTFAYGCAGTVYYRDFDGDAFGSELSGYTKDCAKPMYFANVVGDCNDNDERIFPGQKEACNGRDDNCDGKVDEGLAASVTVYPDADGDGHGAQSGGDKGMTIVGCKLPAGYGFGTDDCDDTKPTVFTGAPEICDYIDNNCNGRSDEDARPACGVGWCRRLAASCTSDLCTPGAPRAEACNAFDDDCDGINDNGTDVELCGATGLTCVEGYCVKPGTVPDAGVRDAATGTGKAGTGGGTGTAGTTGSGTGVAGGSPNPTGAGGDAPYERPPSGCTVPGGGPAGVVGLGLGLVVVLGLALGARVARGRRRRY